VSCCGKRIFRAGSLGDGDGDGDDGSVNLTKWGDIPPHMEITTFHLIIS